MEDYRKRILPPRGSDDFDEMEDKSRSDKPGTLTGADPGFGRGSAGAPHMLHGLLHPGSQPLLYLNHQCGKTAGESLGT